MSKVFSSADCSSAGASRSPIGAPHGLDLRPSDSTLTSRIFPVVIYRSTRLPTPRNSLLLACGNSPTQPSASPTQLSAVATCTAPPAPFIDTVALPAPRGALPVSLRVTLLEADARRVYSTKPGRNQRSRDRNRDCDPMHWRRPKMPSLSRARRSRTLKAKSCRRPSGFNAAAARTT